MEQYANDCVAEGYEGIMIKKQHAPMNVDVVHSMKWNLLLQLIWR